MQLRLAITLALATAPAYAQPVADPPPAQEPTQEPTPEPTQKPTPEPTLAPTQLSPASAAPAASITASDGDTKTRLDLRPGGYLQADARSFATDTGSHEQTLRRLRFKVDGTAFKYFKLNTLIETASSKLQVLNAWVEFSPRPEIGLRVGKDKAQFGIERLQSATALTFIERAYPTQLAPNRDIGVALRGDLVGGVIHYSAAVVNGVANNAVSEGETDDELEYNLHLLVSPLKQVAPDIDLGIGAATTLGRTRGTVATPGSSSIKSAGQATIFKLAGGGASDTMETTAVVDGFRKRFTGHAYYYGGPFGALAEYVADFEPVALDGTHTVLGSRAWQVATSLALTPGDRPTFKSIKPKRPFDLEAGTWGAVEVAARYSELRIDEAAFSAALANPTTSIRRARAGTLGVNWYFNEYVKVQLDYEGTTFDGGAPSGDRPTEHLIATRFQVSI